MPFNTLKYKEIGIEMKKLESQACPSTLSNDKPIIFRLDGHKFSTFTKCFRKPFDALLHNALVETAKDLMNEFSFISTAYAMSDEITLYVPRTVTRTKELLELPFGGRILKTCSLLSGFASTRFNFHVRELLSKTSREEIGVNELQYSRMQEMAQLSVAYFDARGHNLDSDVDALYNILWRCVYDSERNSKMNLGFTYYTPKQLFGLKSQEVVEKLLREKNINWNDFPSAYKWGTTIKRKRTFKTSLNPKTGLTVQAVRTDYLPVSFKYKRDEGWSSILSTKYWDDLPNELFEVILPNHENIPEQRKAPKRKRNAT